MKMTGVATEGDSNQIYDTPASQSRGVHCVFKKSSWGFPSSPVPRGEESPPLLHPN